jgi:REP element-mobilizing transposase RayT
MENHIHAIVQAPELSAVLTDLKKFTAWRLLEQIQREGRGWLFQLLAENQARHRTASRHQLWQEGFHPQAILDGAMMLQNLDYLHHNPVRRCWVASPERWCYSSAHEWLPGASPLLRCGAWR